MSAFNGSTVVEDGQRSSQALESAQADLNRLIDSLSTDGKAKNGNGPIESAYLIVSSRHGLTQKYGERGFRQIDHALKAFRQAVEAQTGLDSLLIYVDDAACLSSHGMQPVHHADPEQVKHLIDALDRRLERQGRRIHYLLIVGGDTIIPFHRLQNPLDDQDTNVVSDNAYASRDADYLIPQRAVGRLPDGAGDKVDFLQSLIQTAIEGHRSRSTEKGLLNNLMEIVRPTEQPSTDKPGQGYSASIWRKASRDVFKTIGHNRYLRTSPPLTYEEFKIASGPHFSYYNLHGVEDGPNWYGQRDGLFPADYALFPVALRPEDLTAADQAKSVVFTEACYGAHILGKSVTNSMALRFLDSQALALVGSTKIAYGSIAPPLIGADLMGKFFWEGLQAHLPLGDALKYAKLKLAHTMQERQGYLDGEDQKTLVSFVLYGDPSLPGSVIHANAMTRLTGKTIHPALACRRSGIIQKRMLPDALVAKVKGQIEVNLPHMTRAQVQAAPLRLCSGACDHRCSTHQPAAKATRDSERARSWTLTLKKDLPVENDAHASVHRQVVRVTADGAGHILKLAVSK